MKYSVEYEFEKSFMGAFVKKGFGTIDVHVDGELSSSDICSLEEQIKSEYGLITVSVTGYKCV